MPIYTRTGDKGETGLANGKRVPKNSPEINFVGMLDEINALVGIVISQLQNNHENIFIDEIKSLEKIQNNIFVIGSIAVYAKLNFKISDEVKFLESKIDEYEKILPKLTNFILPGGHMSASQVHLLRTSTRKLEILAHNLKHPEIIEITPYLNRLSDYFFVLARYINFKSNYQEPIWKISE